MEDADAPGRIDGSVPLVNASASPIVTDRPDARRFEAHFGDELVGFVGYRHIGSRRVLLHTEVLPRFEARGVGSALAIHIFESARRDGERLTVTCPFLSAWLVRHPDYQDVATVPPPAAAT